MKVVILAGGKGSRLRDTTDDLVPKPMVRVGNIPMLEHIIRIYASQGFKEFIVAGGHLIDVIMEWNKTRTPILSDKLGISFIEVVDTGAETQTGGRLKSLADQGVLEYEPFMMTYGDGMADVNLQALLQFHIPKAEAGVSVTLTAVNPPSRFGMLKIENGYAKLFGEKTQAEDGWINGGFYIIEPEALDMINGEACRWEFDVLPVLAIQGRLAAYQHPGFFQMCDTWRDLQVLTKLYKQSAPWLRMENNDVFKSFTV